MSATHEKIDPEPYVSLAIDKLIAGARLPFDVFIKDRSIVVPLFNRGTVYDDTAQNILRERGIRDIYVTTTAGQELETYLVKEKTRQDAIPDPETFNQYVTDKNQHHMVERSLLFPGTKVAFSLFALDAFHVRALLPATEQTPLAIDDAVVSAPGDIVIKHADIPLYQAYLETLLLGEKTALQDRVKLKSLVIRENSKLIIKDLLEEPRSGEKIKESIVAVNQMVDAILTNRAAAADLLTLKTYDYYTYTHSVNVAVLSVGLGLALGLKRNELEQLGIGAMLHDVGKGAIPISILNKPGRLSDDEYTIIKTHVREGENVLRIHKEIPRASFDAVSQHHEKLTGKGYPNNRAGEEVSLFGRLTSIVDCYDALTTKRCYQPARTPFFALSIITKEPGDYDPEILKIFIKMLGELKG